MNTSPVLHYETYGDGPVAVLLHGYMSSNRYWHTVIKDLQKTHKVYALDLLGFGMSPKPKCSSYDVESQVSSIKRTLESIGVTEPFTLVGHSMGALISLRYANNYPKDIKKLLLTNMPVFASEQEAKQDIYGTNIVYKYGLRPYVHSLVWPVFKATVKYQLLRKRLSESIGVHKQYMFQSHGISRIRSMKNLIFKSSVEAELAALTVRTTILTGLHDRAVYLQNLTKFKLPAHVSLHVFEDGHHVPYTRPDAVIGAILDRPTTVTSQY